MSAPIVAQGLVRAFDTPNGTVEAVRGLDLSVGAGEFCVIVGPSGCGKSTFLRMVAGLDRPTAGTLEIGDAGSPHPTNAVVFQGRSLFPWKTIRQNVEYGLALRGDDATSRRTVVDRQLDLLGLSRFASSYPHQVSEGMRQRVAIGRAFAVDPDILLMDEPFGALDEQTRLIMQEELLRIWEQTGKTVLFITHSLDEAILLADRIVVMSAQPGTVRAIIDVPFARPRTLESVRTDPKFNAIFMQTWELLRDEVTRARALAGEAVPV